MDQELSELRWVVWLEPVDRNRFLWPWRFCESLDRPLQCHHGKLGTARDGPSPDLIKFLKTTQRVKPASMMLNGKRKRRTKKTNSCILIHRMALFGQEGTRWRWPRPHARISKNVTHDANRYTTDNGTLELYNGTVCARPSKCPVEDRGKLTMDTTKSRLEILGQPIRVSVFQMMRLTLL